jgi:hypothetical protein
MKHMNDKFLSILFGLLHSEQQQQGNVLLMLPLKSEVLSPGMDCAEP